MDVFLLLKTLMMIARPHPALVQKVVGLLWLVDLAALQLPPHSSVEEQHMHM